MTPNELAKHVHRDLSPLAPRLAAALNRALADMGSGLIITPGQNPDQPIVYHEQEAIVLKGAEPAAILAKLREVLIAVETHSAWQVIIEKKPGLANYKLELMYTIFQQRD